MEPAAYQAMTRCHPETLVHSDCQLSKQHAADMKCAGDQQIRKFSSGCAYRYFRGPECAIGDCMYFRQSPRKPPPAGPQQPTPSRQQFAHPPVRRKRTMSSARPGKRVHPRRTRRSCCSTVHLIDNTWHLSCFCIAGESLSIPKYNFRSLPDSSLWVMGYPAPGESPEGSAPPGGSTGRYWMIDGR